MPPKKPGHKRGAPTKDPDHDRRVHERSVGQGVLAASGATQPVRTDTGGVGSGGAAAASGAESATDTRKRALKALARLDRDEQVAPSGAPGKGHQRRSRADRLGNKDEARQAFREAAAAFKAAGVDYRKAVAIKEKTLGAEHPSTLNTVYATAVAAAPQEGSAVGPRGAAAASVRFGLPMASGRTATQRPATSGPHLEGAGGAAASVRFGLPMAPGRTATQRPATRGGVFGRASVRFGLPMASGAESAAATREFGEDAVLEKVLDQQRRNNKNTRASRSRARATATTARRVHAARPPARTGARTEMSVETDSMPDRMI
jgi:hypothetical protein